MNILLINHYAGSPRHGMAYRPYYLAREWIHLGHQVRIVAASHSHLRSVAPATSGPVTEESVDGIPYVWLRTPAYHGNGVRRALNMVAFVGRLTRYATTLVQGKAPDVVIASSTYPLDNVPARRIARRWGARHVFEVHDLWPLSPIELGGMSPRHPFILLMQWAENYACRHAHKVISILPGTRPHLEAHGMPPERFFHVPNGISPAEWSAARQPLPEEHAHVIQGLRSQDHFVLGYAGGHALSNALGPLVEAAAFLKHRRIAIVLVGSGVQKPALVAAAQSYGLGNIFFLPPVLKACVPELLEAMDALYLGWQNKPIYRFGVSPNKVFDYMMAARPIIHSTGAGNDVVVEAGCGISVPPEEPAAIADAILQLAALPREERERMGQRGRDYVLRHHDYAVLARRFLEALQQPKHE